jgi:Flp pilus assembly protein TadB
MSTEAIIVIVAVVLIALVAWALMQRMSGKKRRERAIGERREEAAVQEKTVAQERMERAERAEQQARMERAAAEQHQTRAEMHEEGHLDHEHAAAVDTDGDGVRDDREGLASERDAQVPSNGRVEGTTSERTETRRF